MRDRKLTLLASVLFIAAASCQTVQNLHIENPHYTMRDIRPHVSIALPLSASSIDFDMNVEIDNPNRVGLNLDRIDFDLLVDGQNVVNGYTSDQVRIPSRGRGLVRLRARVGADQLRSAFRSIAEAVQGNRARYEVRGRAFYNTPIGRMDFPFTVYRADL